MSVSAVQLLVDRLGLTDDEVLRVLDVDPLTLMAGEVAHKPELPLLLRLTEAPAERLGPATLRRWLRTSGPHGRPIDRLTAREFGAFEDALETLDDRGLVVRRAR
ncbi:MAG: hypothetical protein AB7G37_11645 [Solirubrobacteraceae bacterium]